MTANEMIPAIGARVMVQFESLRVECGVRDVKTSWGRPRLLVVPVAGHGEQWVELGRVLRLLASNVVPYDGIPGLSTREETWG